MFSGQKFCRKAAKKLKNAKTKNRVQKTEFQIRCFKPKNRFFEFRIFWFGNPSGDGDGGDGDDVPSCMK